MQDLKPWTEAANHSQPQAMQCPQNDIECILLAETEKAAADPKTKGDSVPIKTKTLSTRKVILIVAAVAVAIITIILVAIILWPSHPCQPFPVGGGRVRVRVKVRVRVRVR